MAASRRPLATLALLVFAAGAPMTAAAASGDGAGTMIARASLDIDGGDPNHNSIDPFVSSTGRFVAFGSDASDLIPVDDNGLTDVFLTDLVARSTVRVNEALGGEPTGGWSAMPAISASGRYVAFVSHDSNLVAGDDNDLPDAFVRDLEAGTTIRAGTNAGVDDIDTEEFTPSISATGRYVAFSSFDPLVTGDQNGVEDVYVRDLRDGGLVRASVDVAGGDTDARSASPSISASGRYLAFFSSASDIVPGDGNGEDDIFVRDLVAGTTIRASVDMEGGDADSYSQIRPSISADGRRVAFSSGASDLVPDDGNRTIDSFVRDLRTGTTVRASVDVAGGDADAPSQSVSLSGDGRHLAFRSKASDLVAGDGNGLADIFVRDLLAGATTRVSVDVDGGDPDDNCWNPSINRGGGVVAFVSFASDLVADDANGFRDVFVRRLQPQA